MKTLAALIALIALVALASACQNIVGSTLLP
jgi:hypothetical protein